MVSLWTKITAGTPKQCIFKLIFICLSITRVLLTVAIHTISKYHSGLQTIKDSREIPSADYGMPIAFTVIGVVATMNSFIVDGLKNILVVPEMQYQLVAAIEFAALVLSGFDLTFLSGLMIVASGGYFVITMIYIAHDLAPPPSPPEAHRERHVGTLPLVIVVFVAHGLFLWASIQGVLDRIQVELWLDAGLVLVGMFGASVSLHVYEFSIYLEYYHVSWEFCFCLFPYMAACMTLCVLPEFESSDVEYFMPPMRCFIVFMCVYAGIIVALLVREEKLDR